MKPADVRTQIQSGETRPLYLLEGDDLQSRHDLALEFAGVVDEGLQAFNVQSFHANEASTAATRDVMIGEMLSAARTLPMMAPRRVLLVHEADRLLSPRKGKDEEPEPPPAPVADKKRRKSLTPVEELEQYFESPEPMTTLVFVAGDLDANRRLVKLLRKHAVAVDCGSLESEGEATRWIQKRLEADHLTIEAPALKLLLASTRETTREGMREVTRYNLGRLRAHVDKLALFAAGERTVTAAHVREVVTPSEGPEAGLAVGMAIQSGNARRALRQLSALFDSGAPYLPILGQIRWAAGTLKPDDRARRALDLVLETDLALKSSGGEPQYLLERLVIELCAQ